MIRLKIKDIAEEKGFNMASLSRKSNLGFSTIRRLWKNPYKHVNIDTLNRIAEALGVSPLDLIEIVPDIEKT